MNKQTTTTGSAASDFPWPTPPQAWFMVMVLTMAYTFSFLDRTILNLLVGPIRADLHISDFQMSLVMGTAFGIFYAIMGLPLSRWIDRYSRKKIIFVGVTTWSLMTAACGKASTYMHLFLARIGIGVGEATLNPSAFSMVGDAFEEKKRSLAIAVFHLGIPIGTGAALIIGGFVIDYVAQIDPATIPVLHLDYSWQLTFMIVGLPGLLVALLMLVVVEPRRRGLLRTEGTGQATRQKVSVGEVSRFIGRRKLAYFAIYFGVGIKIMLSYGNNTWIPTHFIRNFGWSAGSYGSIYGPATIVVGSAAIILCGWVANRLAARGMRDANFKIILFGYLVGIPFAIAAPLVSDPYLAITLFMVTYFFTNFHVLAPAALVAITPNQMRGQISALYVFIVNILGVVLGPSIVAVFTDFLFGYDAAVGKSLALTAAILGPMGLAVLWLGQRAYQRCLEDSLEWERETAPAH